MYSVGLCRQSDLLQDLYDSADIESVNLSEYLRAIGSWLSVVQEATLDDTLKSWNHVLMG